MREWSVNMGCSVKENRAHLQHQWAWWIWSPGRVQNSGKCYDPLYWHKFENRTECFHPFQDTFWDKSNKSNEEQEQAIGFHPFAKRNEDFFLSRTKWINANEAWAFWLIFQENVKSTEVNPLPAWSTQNSCKTWLNPSWYKMNKSTNNSKCVLR